jgi:hypothetical protein
MIKPSQVLGFCFMQMNAQADALPSPGIGKGHHGHTPNRMPEISAGHLHPLQGSPYWRAFFISGASDAEQ